MLNWLLYFEILVSEVLPQNKQQIFHKYKKQYLASVCYRTGLSLQRHSLRKRNSHLSITMQEIEMASPLQ